MAVLIGGARIDENGNVSGGKPGDQTGKEVATGSYYLHNLGWYVIRPNSEDVAKKIADNMEWACKNSNIGYSQSNRGTLKSKSAKHSYNCSLVTEACECDCSSLVQVCVLYAGITVGSFSTSTEVSTLSATGQFTVLKDSYYCGSSDNLKRGDILVTQTKGHTEVVLSNGKNVSQSYATSSSSSSSSDSSSSTSGSTSSTTDDGLSDSFFSDTLEDLLGNLGALYQEEVSKGDAVLRQVGYFNNQYKPSIHSSSITLSVINYTNMLGELFSMYIPQNVSSMNSPTSANFDGVRNVVAKMMLRALVSQGLNAAASCGIVGNIDYQSGLSAGYLDVVNKRGGICGWQGTRLTAMQAAVGYDWTEDLSGQLDYMRLEMKANYNEVVTALKAVPETLEGAKSASDSFMKYLGVTDNTNLRQARAKQYWEQVVIQQI